MEIRSIIDKIKALPSGNAAFVLCHYDQSAGVYYGKNKDGNFVFVIESATPNIKPSSQITKELRFDFNHSAELFIDGKQFNKCIHLLTCLSTDISNIEAFIRLSQSFALSMDKTTDTHYLNRLFNAFVSLFAKGTKPSEKELQGLFAELYVLLYFDRQGVDLYKYWQSKEKMKFDFSITERKRLEVKSTSRDLRIHHFLHEQLLTDFYDIKVLSLFLRKADKGVSLLALINHIRNSSLVTYDILLHIERIIKHLRIDELSGCIFDKVVLESGLKCFSAENIPHFNEKQPNGVFNTEYDCDLTNTAETSLTELIAWIGEK